MTINKDKILRLIHIRELDDYSDEEQVIVLEKTGEIIELKRKAETIAKERNVHALDWEDFSLPTMGNDKLKPPSEIRLKISESEYLYVCE